MKERTLKLEGAACTLMESGDVLISRRRVRGVFVLAFGVALVLVGVGIFILSLPSDPKMGLAIGILVLVLGGVLSSIGIRALAGPEISIVVADRLIRVRPPGSQPVRTRSFDALRGPVEVVSRQKTLSSVTVRLRFDEDEPLSLFVTWDTKKAQEIVRWLEAAFAPQDIPEECPACGACIAPGSQRCNECGVALVPLEATEASITEELQPEELEELLEELEGESEEQETLSPQVEELLQNLKPATRPMLRIRAAKQLGEITTSSRQVVQALTIAAETDSVAKVRATAAESLHAPVHQEWLQQHPELKEAAERALQQHPRSPTGDGPTVEESGKSFKSGIVWNLGWAVVYLLAVVGTFILAWEQVGDWAPWVAGVVWFGGGVSGLVILVQKGHWRAEGILDWVGSALKGNSCLGTLIMIPLLLALVGPVILPVALLIRPRDPLERIAKRRARTKDTDPVKPGPAGDRDEPSNCNACGAWVAPGSEHCGECGAVQ